MRLVFQKWTLDSRRKSVDPYAKQVWISPVNANTPKGYHGYWTQDFYAENLQFGTADDLKALSAAIHARKMVN